MRPGNAEPDATCPWCGLQAHPFQLVQHTWTHTIPVKRRAGEPTALQVVDELQRLTGTTVPAARVWACQYASYSQWDLSTVYGPLDWS